MTMNKDKKFSLLYEEEKDKNVDEQVYRQSVFSESKHLLDTLEFKNAARYRCTQVNLTKLLNEITFSSTIKTQYLLSTAKKDVKYFHTLLEDYIYEIDPPAMKVVFEAIQPVEFIRNDIKFSQNERGEVEQILNFSQLQRKWNIFRDKDLPNLEFYKRLKEQNEAAIKDMIQTGNKEFSKIENLINNIDKNLFYHVLLRANVGNDLADYTLRQGSQLFPNLELVTDVVKRKVSEDDKKVVYHLVGTLRRDSIDDKKLSAQYDKLYKPVIKYSYSEFDYIYRIVYTLNAETGILLDAQVSLSEKVKNNYETITQFTIEKVEL